MKTRIAQIYPYIALMRLNKPIGILLFLWPTFWALWIAGNGHPNETTTLIFFAGVVIMRSAGCVINDFADRFFDGKVDRTKYRPLATGAVKPWHALTLFGFLCFFAFGLFLLLNPLTKTLAIICLFFSIIYPFLKRFTHLPQLGLGFTFSWGVPMAFSQITNTIPIIAWLLMLSVIIWSMIYDTQYAMVDRDDDIKIGIKSTAILFGKKDVAIISILQITMIGLLFYIGWFLSFGLRYYIGILATMVLFFYQYTLIKNRQPADCFKAFMNNQWVGFFIFLGLL